MMKLIFKWVFNFSTLCFNVRSLSMIDPLLRRFWPERDLWQAVTCPNFLPEVVRKFLFLCRVYFKSISCLFWNISQFLVYYYFPFSSIDWHKGYFCRIHHLTIHLHWIYCMLNKNLSLIEKYRSCHIYTCAVQRHLPYHQVQMYYIIAGSLRKVKDSRVVG